jgi:hypothetical protein
MKKEDFVIDHQGIDILDSVYCELYMLEQLLETSVLNPQLAKRLKTQRARINKLIKPHRDFQNAESDRKFKYFLDEGDKMKLDSVWSMTEIDNLDYKHPYRAFTHMSYEGELLNIGSTNTYRELWQTADKIIKLSGDSHHIFIEGFTENDSTIELITGS